MSASALLPTAPTSPGAVFAATIARANPDGTVGVTLNGYSAVHEWPPAVWVAAGQTPVRGDAVLALIDDTGSMWAFPSAPWTAVPTPEVTTLPTSPYNGQTVDLLVDSVGTYGGPYLWRCKYRSATAGSFKWHVLGQPELHAAIEFNESTTSSAYANLTTTGPTITLPFAGDWGYAMEANATNGTAAQVSVFIGLSVAGAGLITPDQSIGFFPAVSSMHLPLYRSLMKPGLAAGTTLQMKYAVSPGSPNSASFERRRLRAWPVRIG